VNLRPLPAALIVLLAAALAAPAAPAPATKAAATKPAATQPEFTPEQKKRLQVLNLTRKSLELFKAKKYAEVEAVLTEALVLEPDHSTNIYNMACLKAVTKRPDEAVVYLERAADAGFTDFIHIDQDEDLKSLHDLPRYKALIKAKDFYQKKDADRALASLKRQLGDKYLYDLDTEAKLIFAANTDAQTLAAVKKWLTAQAKSQWEQLFERHPDQYVAVVLPSPTDYRKMIKMPGVEGIYMHGPRMLIAKRLGQVMTHEFTHALHAGDLDALGQDHPIWIVEGIASLFEAGNFEGDKLVPKDNYRLWWLQSSHRMKRLIPLDKLITWKQSQFVANANLGYGQASSVMLYLYEHDLLRKFYDTYKAKFDTDPSGKATLEQVTGKPVKEFEKDWIAWMMKRTPPAMNTGPDGPFIGVQFAQENDGLKIEQVVAKGPAATAGIKAGDVVVGLNDLDVRDQQSLMPLLKEFKPGDGVVFKLRRGEDYLQLPVTLGKRGGPTATTKPAPKKAP
jgi:tetratricopeptide (TPR) repeat protein